LTQARGLTRQHDGVVSDHRPHGKEEPVEICVQPPADLAAPLQDLEGQVADEARGVDRDGDVGQGQEEGHDVDGLNAVPTQRPSLDFYSRY